MKTISVQVREELFVFDSKQGWVDSAKFWFRQMGHTSESTICVDVNGLICSRGKQFDEAVYPVTVYAIDDAPFKPQGMTGERELATPTA